MHTDHDGILHIGMHDPDGTEALLDGQNKNYRNRYALCTEQPKERKAVKEPPNVVRYRPIAKEVEAWVMVPIFTQEEREAFFAWCPDARFRKKDQVLVVDTLEGDVPVNINDYVVKLEDSFIVLSREEHYRKYEYAGKKYAEGTAE